VLSATTCRSEIFSIAAIRFPARFEAVINPKEPSVSVGQAGVQRLLPLDWIRCQARPVSLHPA
jgi:hypothetical protein